MHRIVVVPFAAPNKAVALKNLDDPVRDAVVVRNRPIGIAGGAPAPIIGIVRININCDAEGMSAQLIGSGDWSPVKRAASLENIFLVFRRELIEFGGDRCELPVNSVDTGDSNRRVRGMRQPGNGGEMRFDFLGGGAIHFLE